MEYQKISNKFACRFCKEKFDQPKSLYLHLSQAHSTAPENKDNRTCPLCGAQCAKYEGYKDHLLHIHGQRNEGQKLNFKCLNDFLMWRSELEKKHNCRYSLQNAPKNLPSNDKQYIYQCNRSDPKLKEKKNTVVMRTCPSVISVVELSGNQQLKVEYWDTHSGHSTSGIPVSKEELTIAVNSVEIDHVMEEYQQSYENAEDYLASEDTNGVFIKSSDATKKAFDEQGSSLTPSTSSSTGQTAKIVQSNKVDSNKKKNTASSVLYSLASVACGKTPVNKKTDTSKTVNKGKGNSEVNASSESSPKTAQTTSKTVGGKLAVSSVKHSPKTDTAIIIPAASTTSTSQVSNTGSISQLPASHLSNNNAFAGQVLLINPLNVGQETVNATQNVFSPGQNILFSFGSVGQNILPAGQASVSYDQKMEAGETNTSVEKDVTPSNEPLNIKKAAPNRKRKISTSNSTTPATQCNLNEVTAGIVNPAVSNTDVINSSGTVLLGTLPVGSTFMTINNNLVPVRSTPTNFLPQNSVILTPTVPVCTAENTVISTPLLNLTPKTVLTPSKPVTGPLLSQSQTTNTAVSTTVIPTSSVREISIGQSSLNTVSNNVISFSSPVLNNFKSTLPVSGLTQSVPSLSSQNVIDALPLGTVPISSTPAINMPSIPSQKPGTLFFESGGDIYMLEPFENEVPKSQSSPAVATKPAPNKVKEIKTKQSPVSRKKPEEAAESIVLKKRTLAGDDDSAVLQKLKYYQLEKKYMASLEECQKLKIELAKANLKNKDSQNLEIDGDLNKSAEAKKYEDEVDKYTKLVKEYEDRLKDSTSIYTMVQTSVLRSLYTDLEDLCEENKQLFNELDSYRKHDKFYKSLRKKIEEEDF